MNPLLVITVIPVAAGILGFLIHRLRNEFHFIGTAIILYYSIYLFITTRKPGTLNFSMFTLNNINFGLYFDQFSGVIILLIAVTSFLVLLYSLRSMRGYKYLKSYYLLLLTTISIANGLILSNNLILLFVFSVLLLIILYIFILMTVEKPSIVTNQMLLLVGISNILILLGVTILLYRYQIIFIIAEPRLTGFSPLLNIAFILILIGVIGKTGFVPLHSWTLKLVKSPVTIMTFVPMIIDRITGIYLLFRLSYFIFNINDVLLIRVLILILGCTGVVIAGLMALKTNDAYRLLTFSSIVQIGLIFIGIGCANPFGLAGSIYHLVNYLTFQPSLLLAIGSVQYWTKNTLMNNFQGLASKMPATYFTVLVAALACIGLPPFNGFFSKWLLFQGSLNFNLDGTKIITMILSFVILFSCIIAPIYFLKLLYAFQGKETKYSQKIRDPGFTMSSPPALFSIFCIILGIFSYSFVWRTITIPVVSSIFPAMSQVNPWNFGLAPILLITSFVAGSIIYYIKVRKLKIASL